MEALYMARAKVAYTGDTTGREWALGWAVYRNDPFYVAEDDQKAYVVYEDDGRGNGNYVGDFDTLEAAARHCDKLAKDADDVAFAVSAMLAERAQETGR